MDISEFMINPRCQCELRNRGYINCPVHNPDVEDYFIQELEKFKLKRRKRQESTSLQETETNTETVTDETMDELLTQLVNLNTTVANATQATNQRVAEMIDEHCRVKIKEPKEFKGEDSYDINDFLGQFDRYCRLNRVADETKALLFSTYLGTQPLQYYESLDGAIKANFGRLRQSFIAEYNPENRKFHRRQRLSRRKMKETESVKDFYISLQTEARKLEYPDEGTLQLFIEGLAPEIKEHVLLQAPNTINEAYRHAQAKESAMESRMEEENSTTRQLLPVLNTLVKSLAESQSKNQKINTSRCTGDLEMLKRRLDRLEQAYNYQTQGNYVRRCYICGEPGHLARGCRRNEFNHKGYVNQVNQQNGNPQNEPKQRKEQRDSSMPAFSAAYVHKVKCYHNYSASFKRYIHHEKQQYNSTRQKSNESNDKSSLRYKQTECPDKSSSINPVSFTIENVNNEASKQNIEVSEPPSVQLPKENSEEEKSDARHLDSCSEVEKSVETSEASTFKTRTNGSEQNISYFESEVNFQQSACRAAEIFRDNPADNRNQYKEETRVKIFKEKPSIRSILKETDKETDQVSDTSRLNTQISPKKTTLKGKPTHSKTFFISKTQAKNLIFKFTSFVFSLLIIFRMVRVDFVQTDQNSKARNNYGKMKVFNYITGSLSSKVLKVSLLSRVTSDIVAIFRCHTCGPGNSDKLILTL